MKTDLSKSAVDLLKVEATILEELDHPNIIKMKHVSSSSPQKRIFNNYIILAVELGYGSLADFLRKKKKRLNDEESSIVMKQIIQGVRYLHQKDYIHWDIKPGNILIMDENTLQVKLIDFGLVQWMHQSEDHCGTLIYQSPEQAIEHRYGKSADVWACGFTMYEILTGDHPLWYWGISKEDYLSKLSTFNVETLFPNKYITPLAQSLLTKILNYRSINRYTISIALQHPFITRRTEDSIPMTMMEQ